MIMNIKEQEKRLEDIFRRNNNKGFAVAITGSWGVGKTFFWNNFINEKAKAEQDRQYLPFSIREKYKNLFNKKYSYVSLFGIENLADLRAAISMNMSSNSFNENVDKNLEVPKPFKKLLSGLRDLKFNNSEYGISGSARLLESLLYKQVRDAIICFDDFERLSEKLNIQDVMGLANQLKLERKCQVILILDESKNDEENKKKYAEYKEKLIDETIKITSVEPLIRENSDGIDEDLIGLMVKFADELEIHNFRFFQKVINLYREFRGKLPEEVAYSTKEIILVRILQGYLIEDYGHEFDIGWESFSNNRINSWFKEKYDQNSDTQEEGKKNKKLNKFAEIYPNFSQIDLWGIEFKKWFDQKSDFNPIVFEDLISSDLLNEDYDKSKEKINELILKYKKYNIDSSFTINLASEIKKIIKFDTLETIEFYCSLLLEFDEQDEINQIDQLVREHLQSEFQINRERMLKRYYWHEDKEQKYRTFIKDLLDDPNSFQQQEFSRILELYIYKGGTAYGSEKVLYHMTKKHLENFIKDEYPSAFKTLSLKTVCEKIIELYELKQSEMVQKVKLWLKEIIENIGKSKGYPQHYINYFTEKL